MATIHVTVELDILGTEDDVQEVIDNVLDNGAFQEALTEYAEDTGRELAVQSIVLAKIE
jgi:hypothetical protein